MHPKIVQSIRRAGHLLTDNEIWQKEQESNDYQLITTILLTDSKYYQDITKILFKYSKYYLDTTKILLRYN